MTCEKQHIYIYKGDDTNWNNEQFLTVNITSGSPSIDLSTMTAVFTLGKYTQSYSLSEGAFQVDLSAAVTGQFPYGFAYGSLQILDSQGRIRTATNKIPFYVTSDPIGLQNQDIEIDIPGAVIDVTVGGTVSYNNISDKPAINDVTIEGNQSAGHYGLATTAGLSQKVSKSGDTMSGNLVMEQGTQITMTDGALKSDDGMLGLEGPNYWLRVDTTSGLGAAIKSTKGVGDILTALDVKSTYSASGMDPVNGQAVANAISSKQDTITGAATSITSSNLSANKAVISDGNGKISNSNVTAVELGYVSGVTGAIQTQITNEVNARTYADNNLQGQIDAISAASDVTDIVGTYAELQAYDTQHLKDNDIIKVLSDSTHDGASSYYRWSTSTETFTYVGSEGPYYTKSEADAEFLSQSSASTTYLTQMNAASTYETQSAATTALALKASNADGATIIDSGSAISTIAVKEQRASAAIKQWIGTKEQYDAIENKDVNTLYVITDDEDSSALIVDNALSLISENPVQNKVITAALQNIDALPSQSGNSGKFLTTNGTTASWATVSAGANTSLSNLTDAGKIQAAHLSMPSNVYDELTVPASGTILTAPADGVFFLAGRSTGAGSQYMFLGTGTNSLNSVRKVQWQVPYQEDIDAGIEFPVYEGQEICIEYSDFNFTGLPYAAAGLKFFYAVGAESKYVPPAE